jgi:hypothetical protein
MKIVDKFRHPVVLSFVLVLVLSLTKQGDGFASSIISKIFTKVLQQTAKAAGSLAGHTWNVVSFKLVESGWNGLFGAIFPQEDKVGETLKEIMDRFDEVENLVRIIFKKM